MISSNEMQEEQSFQQGKIDGQTRLDYVASGKLKEGNLISPELYEIPLDGVIKAVFMLVA